MHCPNCGTETSREQKFCRSCGLALEKVTQLLDEQLPIQPNESLQARKERLERLGVIALSVFGAGVVGMIVYGVIYKLIIVQGRTFEGLGILAFLVVIACGLLAVVLFAQANETTTKGSVAKRKSELSDEVVVGLLPDQQFEPAPSVTEHTTDLLVEKRVGEQIDQHTKEL